MRRPPETLDDGHPSRLITTYLSPFARPNAPPPVRVKVAMLLNSVDEYDVKTGLFAADFFLSSRARRRCS